MGSFGNLSEPCSNYHSSFYSFKMGQQEIAVFLDEK
jgi:hypothetical protein